MEVINFDMYGTLTTTEIDELMKFSDCEIDYENIDVKPAIKRALNEFEIDISKAVDSALNDMRKEFKLK
jgi:hypothetical protein